MPEQWSVIGALPPGAEVGAVALDGPAGLVGGQRTDSSASPVPPKAFVARVEAQQGQQTFSAEGKVVALSLVGTRAAAVLAVPRPDGAGSRYSLIRSGDGGRSWEIAGVIPFPSVEQVTLGPAGRTWILGAHLLAFAEGDRFETVALPGDRDVTREKLVSLPQGVALLGPRTFLDERGRFRELGTGGLSVDGIEGSWVVGHDDAQARVGTLGKDTVGWKGTLPQARQPLGIAVDGKALRVLSRASVGELGTDLTVHRSEDEGRSWTAYPLPLTALTRIQGGRSLGMDLGGKIYGRL